MKNYKLTFLLLLLPFFLQCCQNHNGGDNGNQGTEHENQYSSPEAAVQQAKSDLTNLLKQGKYNFNLDAATVERSQPGKSAEVYEVDFNKLIAEGTDSLAALAKPSQKLQTPLVDNGRVVTTVAVSKAKDGWRLSELTNAELTRDLNEISRQMPPDSTAVEIYEVPNLNATLFAVKRDGRTVIFTRYAGQSLQQPVSAAEILRKLRADAIIFQRTYGEELKKQRLVK